MKKNLLKGHPGSEPLDASETTVAVRVRGRKRAVMAFAALSPTARGDVLEKALEAGILARATRGGNDG
jgi:hypothetical protein